MFRVNLLGTFLGMRTCAPELRKTGGHGSWIVNISSAAAWSASSGTGRTGRRSGASVGSPKTAAMELGPEIRVNSVHPGPIETDMLPMGSSDRFRRLPLARTGKPEEVAELVLFLASDSSSYITGAEFAGRRRARSPGADDVTSEAGDGLPEHVAVEVVRSGERHPLHEPAVTLPSRELADLVRWADHRERVEHLVGDERRHLHPVAGDATARAAGPGGAPNRGRRTRPGSRASSRRTRCARVSPRRRAAIAASSAPVTTSTVAQKSTSAMLRCARAAAFDRRDDPGLQVAAAC